jgi:2-isopropylmalate synthase
MRAMSAAGDVKIYDTTLRDGCQGAGVTLSLPDKLAVARRLDGLRIDYIEGGWPGSNPKDQQFFAAVREEPPSHARVTAFGSTRKADTRAKDDPNLRLLIESEAPVVALVAKASDFHVSAVLRTTPEENLAMIRDSVAFLKESGREVVVDAEHFFDGHHRNRDYALQVLEAAASAGADWLVLCDTNGGTLPGDVDAAVREVVAAFDVPVGVHTHNDCELAVANALAAVAAGARQVQGTVNGYGERVGNANLCTVIPDLVLKLGFGCAAGERLDRLTELSRFVDDLAVIEPNKRLPFVGEAAFAHKGGIHVHAVAREDVREIVERHGFALLIGAGAMERLPAREPVLAGQPSAFERRSITAGSSRQLERTPSAQPCSRSANPGVPASTSMTTSAGTFARFAAATIASAEGAS